ncbi:uncharacterized protein [Diabrotica undecimpunctata]|uniref:uncharacterized protein n=1 Tax=Diabrotica undecimpunctata TaxID=50387 RepID=UPI003B63794F
MVKKLSALFLLPLVLCDDVSRQPMYKYRYETEDVMKTAASTMPVRGYHVVEGGYYPSEPEVGGFGFGGAGFGAGPAGYGGHEFLSPKLAASQVVPIGAAFGGQIVPKYTQTGFLGAGTGFGGLQGGLQGGYQGGLQGGYQGGLQGGLQSGLQGGLQSGLQGGLQSGLQGGLQGGLGLQHHIPHHIGGQHLAKEEFSGGKKSANDEKYEKSEGKQGEEANHGKSGYVKGEVAAKDVKGDSGFYTNVDGEKKVYEDGKEYQGGQHYNKEGKSGEEKTAKQGHKKGHKIKSFKNSHHKDESGKSEEYYDEAHDEGGNYAFNGQSGSFGEKGASEFKGGNQDSKYNSAEAKKEGHFENKHSIDKVEGDQGKYGQNKFAGNEAIFGYKNGADEQSLLGHQESSKLYKAHPFVVPFYEP